MGGDHNKALSKVLGRTNQYMLHVWHVYLSMDFYSFHVGKIYQSHGFYGIYRNVTTLFFVEHDAAGLFAKGRWLCHYS